MFIQLLFFLQFLVYLGKADENVRPKNFIFRLDNTGQLTTRVDNRDIMIPTEVELLNFFMDNGYPVAVNVISDSTAIGQPPLYTPLKRCTDLSKDKCALVNQASGNFSTVYSSEIAIRNADAKIKNIFPGYQAECLSPMGSVYENNIINAMKVIGYLSAFSGYPYYTYNLRTDPLQFAVSATLGTFSNWRNVPTWYAKSKETTLADCNAASDRGEYCIISVDPDIFAPRYSSLTYTTSMLQELIDYLQSNGWSMISLHEVIMKYSPSRSPTVLPTLAPSVPPTIATTTIPWGKCGGQGWTGPFLCPPGFQCVVDTIWYSQCLPISMAPTFTPTRTPTFAKTIKPTPAPTMKKTNPPTPLPTKKPTRMPSYRPTTSPTSIRPSYSPTRVPTKIPPTVKPTAGGAPTANKLSTSSNTEIRRAHHNYLRFNF